MLLRGQQLLGGDVGAALGLGLRLLLARDRRARRRELGGEVGLLGAQVLGLGHRLAELALALEHLLPHRDRRVVGGLQLVLEVLDVPRERTRRRRQLLQLVVRKLRDEAGELLARREDDLAAVGLLEDLVGLALGEEREEVALQLAVGRRRQARRRLDVDRRERPDVVAALPLDDDRLVRAGGAGRGHVLERALADVVGVRADLREHLPLPLLDLPAAVDPVVLRLLRRVDKVADEDGEHLRGRRLGLGRRLGRLLHPAHRRPAGELRRARRRPHEGRERHRERQR